MILNEMDTIKINDSVTLRRIRRSDAPDMFRMIDTQREYLGRWLPFVPWTESAADSEAFIDSVLNAPADRVEYVFTFRVDGQFGGTIGFKDTDRANGKTEIGYWIGEQFQGRGIVTESVKALCRMAFGELGLNRVQIQCAVGNTKSSNIPKKLGFVLEGIERDGELESDGQYADIERYSMLGREFEQAEWA